MSTNAPTLVDDAITLAGGDERLLVHLAVLDVLGNPPPGYRASEVASARDALARRLDTKVPGAIRLMLYSERPKDAPASEADVAALENAVSGTEPMPYAAAYRELRAILDKLDPAMAPGLAMSGSVRLTVLRFHPTGLSDRLRTLDSLPERDRVRLARALVRLAELLADQDTLLTAMMGAATLGMAGTVTENAELKTRSETIRAEVHELQDSARCLRQLMVLPVAGLHKAWADQQPAEKSVLLTRIRRAGLSCPEPEPPWKSKPDPDPASTSSPQACPPDTAK